MKNVELIAKVAHELNKALCESQGDTSQVSWDDAPDWQKKSAINGVKMHLENPDATPEMSHENWLAEKKADGWKYGKVKDADKKEHPCFVPYQQLPESQKAKDYIFRQTIHSLSSMADSNASDVHQFNRTFGHPVSSEPRLIDLDTLYKKLDYIREELAEIEDAARNGDVAGILDGIVDANYLIHGITCSHGLTELYSKAFDLVHAANMSKACKGHTELEDTQNLYNNQGIETDFKEVEPGVFVVYNRATGKIMKSASFVAPDLSVLFPTDITGVTLSEGTSSDTI